MSPDEFDPYHRWLGIPPKKRPPTHYDLLGLPLDEDDDEVIRAAAERQRSFLKRFQIQSAGRLRQPAALRDRRGGGHAAQSEAAS